MIDYRQMIDKQVDRQKDRQTDRQGDRNNVHIWWIYVITYSKYMNQF